MSSLSRLVLVLVALAALGAGAWWLLGRGDAPPASVEPAAPQLTQVAEPTSEPLAASSGRAPVASEEPSAPPAATAAPERAAPAKTAPAARRVRGTALGLSGEPLGDVPIALQRAPEHELARSRPDGGFELEVQLLPGWSSSGVCLTVPDARWAVVRHGCVEAEERVLVLVLAPAIDLAGRVVDEGGRPLAGVRVEVSAGAELLTGFTHVLDDTRGPSLPSTESGTDGRFALSRVPAGVRFALVARQPGRRGARVACPESSRADLELVLPAEEAAGAWTIDGVVLHHDGLVASGARVRLGDTKTATDGDGRFRLACKGARPEASLVAWMKNLQPAVLERFGERLHATDGKPGPVELVLGPPALALAGRVLDQKGEPAAGWQVDLLDGTPVSVLRMPPELVEVEVSGTKLPVATGAGGRFTIRGLSARRYVVRAYQPKSLISVRSEPVDAGRDDVELRVPADATRAGLSGQVVSRAGVPLAGVDVSPQLVLHEAEWGSTWTSGKVVKTDANGRFELGLLPRRVKVAVGGSDVIPEGFTIEAGEPDDGHVLRVAARCHFRVEAGDGEPWQSISAESEDGTGQELFSFQGGGWSSSSNAQLSGGASKPLAVSEDARTLVFWRDGSAGKRVPLQLAAGELVVVRP